MNLSRLKIENLAFNRPDEADLVEKLLNDQTAQTFLSLIAWQKNQAIAHILFTKANLDNTINQISLVILAPLAVIPNYQKQGLGSLLIREGLEHLKKQNIDLVFVFGDPQYYQRFGFQPAEKLGFLAPFPLPQKYLDAWMVLPLKNNIIGSVSGKIKCAETLNKEEYWRE